MNTTDCVATNCPYLKHEKSKGYRCLHPDLDKTKKFYKNIPGKQIKLLKECPNKNTRIYTTYNRGQDNNP